VRLRRAWLQEQERGDATLKSLALVAAGRFPGRGLLISVLTLPLAFPGVVVGFMIIMLGGRQGLVGSVSQFLTGSKWVFAYNFVGLFTCCTPCRSWCTRCWRPCHPLI
jgi:ABC-type sulfate transport system permease component